MKKLVIFLTGMLLAMAAYAQSPVPDPDTIPDPVKQTDPASGVRPQNMNYANDHVKITPKQVPAAIVRTLESGSQYVGWEKGAVYKNKSGSVFTIEITHADTTKTYRFDTMGRPVQE
jgi:hypothetical protein